MFCSQKKYADLVMWTKEDVHIERIYPDDEFWVDKVSRVKLFFENSILPELLGKFISRPRGTLSVLPESHKEVYCYCGGPEEGDMIGCDGNDCKFKWFHLSCLQLVEFPDVEKRYCPGISGFSRSLIE